MSVLKKQSGFTLIELLIVIAIIAVLASVVFVALDPLSRFQDARNSSRWNDVTSILSAIKIDQVDNGGAYLDAISAAAEATPLMIGTETTGCNGAAVACESWNITASSDCVDLTGLVDDGYIGEVPISPNGNGEWSELYTGYYLLKDPAGIITIGACESEGDGEDISVSR